MKTLLAVPAALALAALLLASVPAGSQDMGAMFQDKCVGCHPASRTCEVLDKQGDYWRATVDRMVKQWGALLSPDQAGDMAQWLANQKSGSEPVCP